MPTVMSLPLALVLLMFGASAPLGAYLGSEFPLPSQENASDSPCGPPLTETQLRDIVRRAIRIAGGDPTNLDRDFRLSIHQSGCDYIVIGVRQPETIPQEFAITIDRSGRVKSWPWCCVPEFEIGPVEDQTVPDPPIIITDTEGRHWPLDPPAPAATCTPALFELEKRVEVASGSRSISFRLLVVGCGEDLAHAWPPPLDLLEEAFVSELREADSIQLLSRMENLSPELRSRLTKKLNEVLKGARANDVFIFDATVSNTTTP